MLETPHVALGIAIAVAVPNPLISIPLAFASHFVLDMTPHWNPHLNTETKKYGYLTNKTLLIIGLDLACAVVLTAFASKGNINILLASFASILPDIVEGPYFLLGWKNEFVKKWISFQKSIQSDANIYWGLLTQILVILGALYIIT
jgi:hypothetical protein